MKYFIYVYIFKYYKWYIEPQVKPKREIHMLPLYHKKIY